MLSIVILSVVMLNVIMQSVLAPLGWPNIKLYLLTELDYLSHIAAKASTATVAVAVLV
jgi:hypothetical protein